MALTPRKSLLAPLGNTGHTDRNATSSTMQNNLARQIGEDLKAILARLKALANDARAAHNHDTEAIEIAIVNLDSAIEILTE